MKRFLLALIILSCASVHAQTTVREVINVTANPTVCAATKIYKNTVNDSLWGRNSTSGLCAELGGTAGTAINATNGVIPYRSSSTAFSDSPLSIIDANTLLFNSATAFLRFGGSTSSFPGLKRVGANLEARFADDSAYSSLYAQSFRTVVFYLGGGSPVGTGGMALFSPADGVVRITNYAATDFGRLQLGGTTSSFPAIKRSGTTVAFRLADDSADAPTSASGSTLSSATVPITFSNAAYQSCTGFTSTAGGVLTCTASDGQVKTLRGRYGLGLNALLNLHPQYFSFKQGTRFFDEGRLRAGFVAQDVSNAIPQAVSAMGDGTLQVDNATVLATVVNAVKELSAKVTAQQKEIIRLRAQLRRRR